MLTRRELMRRLVALGLSSSSAAALLEAACAPAERTPAPGAASSSLPGRPTVGPEAATPVGPVTSQVEQTAPAAIPQAGATVAGGPAASLPTPTVPAKPAATAPAKATAVPTVAPTPAPAPVAPTGVPTLAPAGAAYLAVARGDDPAELTRRAVRALGGIERFVKPGQPAGWERSI